MEYPGVKDSVVVCETSQGLELRGSLVRLGRHQVIFEVYNPISVLQTSEVLAQFRIFFKDRTAYSGKAVINNLIHTGLIVLCEACCGRVAGRWCPRCARRSPAPAVA